MWSRLLLALSAVAPALSLPNTSGPGADGITRSAFSAGQQGDYEFIVVGSGAGGGTLAARLAMAGRRTLLIEAGDDQGANLNQQVPAFHAYSTEDPTMAWDFFVNHYPNEADAVLDPKMSYTTPDGRIYTGLNPPPGSVRKGILYPRAGTLGGCTAHNALVTIYPHTNDWDNIQRITGDPEWNHQNMRRLYQKIEDVDYLTLGLVGHGYNGWLGVGQASPSLASDDTKLLSLAVSAATSMGSGNLMNETVSGATNLARILAGDANSGSATRDQTQGVFQIPLAFKNYRRNGSREFVMRVHQSGRFPLDIMFNTLVTRVTWDHAGSIPRATGVEYLRGRSLYRADPRASNTDGGEPGSIRAVHEVILAGGAFNTPQLLKLSGIGPAEELRQHNIPVVVNLPGVGANLQDHMEIGVTHEARNAFTVVDDCTYNKQQPDPCLERWRQGRGPYATSNGFIYSVIKKSSVAAGDTVYGDDPDLLMFGGIANFKGYYPRYSDDVYGQRNWTWVILKAHTGNHGARAGQVRLRTTNPRDVPDINFHFFDAGNTENNAHIRDLRAMMEGVELAREITHGTVVPSLASLAPGGMWREMMPGPERRTEQQLMTHIRNEAWSHHASCTAKIGADNDPMAVLDSKLKVRGTMGLRVADASVFPRIPGFFVAVPTYMIGEQAAEMILGRRT